MKSTSDHKSQHLGRVYQFVEQFELISRTDLAKLSGFAPASITGLTKTLIDHKLILERTAQNLASRGRPAVGLSLSPFHWHYVCLTLSAHQLSIFLCELSGNAVQQQDVPISPAQHAQLHHIIAHQLQQFLSQLSLDPAQILAVSVSVIGKLNRTKSHILQLGNYTLECDLVGSLQPITDKPLFINEHFQLWLLAESTLGSLISSDDVIFLQLDEAINLSVLLRGQVLYRDEHKRMNVDKMLMPRFSEVGEIIAKNCNEMERFQLANQITFTALARGIDHYLPNNCPTLSQKIAFLCQAITQKQPNALLLLEHISDNLAYMLLNLINIFSTEKIMFCSPLLAIQGALFAKIRQKITAHLRQEALNIDLVTSQYDWNSPVIPAVAVKYEIYAGNLIQNIIKM